MLFTFITFMQSKKYKNNTLKKCLNSFITKILQNRILFRMYSVVYDFSAVYKTCSLQTSTYKLLFKRNNRNELCISFKIIFIQF